MATKSNTTMVIGYDAKRAVGNLTGLGNYSRLVLESVAEAAPRSRLMLYAPKAPSSERLCDFVASRPNFDLRLPAKKPLIGALWRSYGITKQLRADGVTLYHGLSNELPLNIHRLGIPTVVTIHDVIYRRLPGCYSLVDRTFCDFKYGRSARLATRIIAISERTKADIVEYYRVDPEKIDVVYQGCDSSFTVDPAAEVKKEVADHYHLPAEFILQVGTIEERKNLALTIRALASLAHGHPHLHLVVVGKDRRGYKERCMAIAQAAGVADRIIWIDDLPFAWLPALCRMATVIAYPSRYEGFGIPVLEALWSRRPVIAATGSCLEEAGGPATIYVDPDSPRSMAEAIDHLLGASLTEIAYIVEAGVKYASRFDPSALADDILAVYHRALAGVRG